jgi:hypothetical protein
MLPDFYGDIDFASVPRIAGAPRFLYRQAAEQWLSWALSLAGRRRPGPWVQQLQAIRFLGILVECWRLGVGRGTSPAYEPFDGSPAPRAGQHDGVAG